MERSKICLIGDIVVDVTLQTTYSPTKLRLGGIVHAARALWALNIPYDLAYFSPAYLDDQIIDYLTHHGCQNTIKLGNVKGAPNVFLIQEAKEVGSQGYEFLLRDAIACEVITGHIQQMIDNKYNDHLLISGNYDLVNLINQLSNNIHVDASNNLRDLTFLQSLTRKINTLFLATSSDLFKHHFVDNFIEFANKFEKYTDEVILKENRGGSRGYNFADKEQFSASSQPRKVDHSVGVGDAFDATYISGRFPTQERTKRLVLSSWVAAEYAGTSFPDDFKKNVSRVTKSDIEDLIKMPGVSLPWEARQSVNVYIAAPDFTFIDTTLIDTLAEALSFHNFVPRRPLKENGQMEEGAIKARKQELVGKDLILLSQCSLMIVVLLYNDPGTLIELGYAAAKEMPIIVYDPFNKASNCMLTELPDLVSSDLDEIITEVFIKSAKLNSNDK